MGLFGELALGLAGMALESAINSAQTRTEIEDDKEIEFDKLLTKWNEILSRVMETSQNSIEVKITENKIDSYICLLDKSLFFIKMKQMAKFEEHYDSINVEWISKDKSKQMEFSFEKGIGVGTLSMRLISEGQNALFSKASIIHGDVDYKGPSIDLESLLKLANKNTEIISKLKQCQEIYDERQEYYKDVWFKKYIAPLNCSEDDKQVIKRARLSNKEAHFENKELFEKLIKKWDELFQRKDWIKNPKFEEKSNKCITKEFDLEIKNEWEMDNNELFYYYDKKKIDNFLVFQLEKTNTKHYINIYQVHNNTQMYSSCNTSVSFDELFALIDKLPIYKHYKKFAEDFFKLKQKTLTNEAEKAQRKAEEQKRKAEDDALAALDSI